MEIIERKNYVSIVLSLLGKGEVVVLTGHRRAGKSCILEQLQQQLKGNGNVVYLDMENPDNSEINDYQQLNNFIKNKINLDRKNYILIDEVQEITEFQKTLRYWVKKDNIDVIVTGSNAAMLSGEIASAFAGRYYNVHINSLNYNEFLQFYNIANNNENLSLYMRWGGLPFLRNIPLNDTRSRIAYLSSIYDTIFVKDIISRHQIRNVTFLKNLTQFIADNIGKIFSPNSIAKFMKGNGISVSASTISEYTEMLCETYMIDSVQRFDIKGKRIFEQQNKFYFEDIGIRNYLCIDKRNNDVEKIVENLVYLKLKNQGNEVYVGQLEDKEIDFVTKFGNQISYYQVTLTISSSETYDREIGNLKRIKDNFPKYLITTDYNATLINDSGIQIIHLADFLLS